MKIDRALQAFTEQYDRDAIQSIEDLSSEVGLREHRTTMPLFNLKEAFDKFTEYLEGYGEYKVTNQDNPQCSPQSVIRNNVTSFIDGHIFEDAEVRYTDLSNFVQQYLEGVTALLETVDGVKQKMLDADVELESVGDVNDFTDHFIGRLQERFDPAMDRILWASGYNARQRLAHPSKKEVVRSRPAFL